MRPSTMHHCTASTSRRLCRRLSQPPAAHRSLFRRQPPAAASFAAAAVSFAPFMVTRRVQFISAPLPTPTLSFPTLKRRPPALSPPGPNPNTNSELGNELGNELDLNKENTTDEEDEGRCARPPCIIAQPARTASTALHVFVVVLASRHPNPARCRFHFAHPLSPSCLLPAPIHYREMMVENDSDEDVYSDDSDEEEENGNNENRRVNYNKRC